jgi:hypothetical protein
MSRLFFAIIAIVLALPPRAFAQEPAYQFTVPPAWMQSSSNGSSVFLPANDPNAGVTMVLLPVQPLAGSLESQAQTLLKGLETSMALSNPRLLPAQRGKADAGEFVILAGTFTANTGANMQLMLFARGEKGALGALLFIALNEDGLKRYGGDAAVLFNNMHVTDQAAKLAAGTPGNPPAAAQPPLQRQPPVAQTGSTPPAEGAAVTHASPAGTPTSNVTLADLTGVWVGDTAIRNESISFGTRTDSWGTTYNTTTYYFQSPLGSGGEFIKIRADGSYQLYHNFVYRGCGTALNHRGTVSVQNGQLTMRPVAGHETSGPVAKTASCDKSDRDTVPPPETYAIEINAYDSVRGYPTYRLRLTSVQNSGKFYVIDRLEARPLSASPPPMTRDFRPGTGHAAGDLQGTWVASDDTSANLSAATPAEGKYHAVLRLLAGGRYELTVQRPDVLYAPVCVKHVALVEQGEAQFAGQIYPGGNKREGGAMVLKPSQSQLSVEVVNCGPEDGKAVYNLSQGPRYMRWTLQAQNAVTAPRAGDKLEVVCPDAYERANAAAWGFLSCPEKAGQVYGGYVRR